MRRGRVALEERRAARRWSEERNFDELEPDLGFSSNVVLGPLARRPRHEMGDYDADVAQDERRWEDDGGRLRRLDD